MTQIVQVKQVVNVNAGKSGHKKKKKSKRGGGGSSSSRRATPVGLRGAISMYDPTTKQPIFVRVDTMREIPTSYRPIQPADLIPSQRLEADNQQIRKTNIQMVREQQIQNGYFQNLANQQFGPPAVQPTQAPIQFGTPYSGRLEKEKIGDVGSNVAGTSGTRRPIIPTVVSTGVGTDPRPQMESVGHQFTNNPRNNNDPKFWQNRKDFMELREDVGYDPKGSSTFRDVLLRYREKYEKLPKFKVRD